MIEKIHKIIKKLESRMEERKRSPHVNDDYIMGLEHSVRFIKIELQDVLNAKGEQNEY